MFKSRRVLDFSAGWGDRLVGCLAAGVDSYVAYDPNIALRKGHQEILSLFATPERQRCFQIHYVGFEAAKITPNSFDLIFTSPPFFDFEIYTSLPGQSVDLYPKFDDWVVKFLTCSIKRAWEGLVEEGHAVIHLTDVSSKENVCERLCLLLLWLIPNLVYRGVICSQGKAERARPLWVFQKRGLMKSEEEVIKRHAEPELRKNYPETHRVATEFFFQEKK